MAARMVACTCDVGSRPRVKHTRAELTWDRSRKVAVIDEVSLDETECETLRATAAHNSKKRRNAGDGEQTAEPMPIERGI